MPADLLDRDAARTAAYAAAARRVGEATRAPTADLHAAFVERGVGWEKALLSDGLHFTAEGQALAFETVLAAVPPETKPATFGTDAPTHDALVGADATDDWHGHLRDDAAERGIPRQVLLVRAAAHAERRVEAVAHIEHRGAAAAVGRVRRKFVGGAW